MTEGTGSSANHEPGAPPGGPALRIVTFTSLYPNAEQPSHGIFVENRLRHLVASGRIASRVVAPVPWVPQVLRGLKPYGIYARVPRTETRHGIDICHPRYPVLPKIGMSLTPACLAAATLPVMRRLDALQNFDLIDAHYFYPDGVAAAVLGACLGKPVIITARGTDINLIPRHAIPRAMIRWAAGRAAGIIAVSQALKDEIVRLGVPAARVRVLRNGVNLDLFRPTKRDATRQALGINGRALLSVGQLIARKGHDLVIGALPRLGNMTLLIAGEGPDRAALEALASSLGVGRRVRFLGLVEHRQLPAIYSAADALVLASSREGWANVLLEAMACGTPVVASSVWGNPEVITRPEAGVLMPELSTDGVVRAVEALFASPPDRSATRRYAEAFSWDATTDGQIRIFTDVLARRVAAYPHATAC